MTVAVVTDSQTCIPSGIAKELEIFVLPYTINLDGRLFLDGVDITPEEFYRIQPSLSEAATTSAISPGAFINALESLSASFDSILIITIASTMSGTYNSACIAAKSFDKVPVAVFDSRTAAMAQGLVVLEIAEAAREGATLDECLDLANIRAKEVELFAYISTFEYLRKSGRVNAITALTGEALSIKPVFRFKDAKATVSAKKRSAEKARVFIADEAYRYFQRKGSVRASVFHAHAQSEAEELLLLIKDRVELQREIILSEFTPVMGCHTGPGVVGAAFL